MENVLKISYLKLLFNVCNEQLACKFLLYKLYQMFSSISMHAAK